ncbi:mucin-2-like [Mixophyes fleayi]|uniref:mucin-2-like n=1 Tax=Mixophyes fleayi TaxID=3061075 RepID=UPI003F4DCE62
MKDRLNKMEDRPYGRREVQDKTRWKTNCMDEDKDNIKQDGGQKQRRKESNLTIFEPTSFYIIVHTNFGLQLEIQLNPIMQVYIYISHSYFGETCGLCGNFNDKQIDDYITPNGMSAQNLNIFVNSWRSDQTCEKVPTNVIDPCSINIQKESYASNWCSTLNSRNKVFAACHSVVNPSPYYEKCLYDTCLCKKSEDCLCAVFSSYVRACAERGITLRNWRLHLCDKYINECQDLMTFKSEVSVCQRTCKSLSVADASCNVKFIPIDGCVLSAETDGYTVNIKARRQQYSSECVSGCVCPTNMLEDGKRGCVNSDKCTCTYNDKVYDHMEQTKIGCKMCTCNNRKWVCDDTGFIAQCAVYGEGNYITFDNRPYRYSGQCEYTLVQDYVLLLRNGDMELKNEGGVLESPFQVRNTSLYLIVKARNGMVLIWDKKTSLTIKISEHFQSNVCGLCGNYDGNSINDFNTRGHFTVEDVIEFGNSWKLSSTCPEVKTMIEPCEINPHRKSWAQRHCSIILGKSFRPCHSEVDPQSYYDACVKDSCACDEGGDCDCFCTAIAVYAQTCLSHCICVEWRTPNRCPVFCDYYNQEGKCEWHYKACGVNCIKTCRNKAGNCTTELPKVEGCYPSCPQNKPYFEEISMECVAECGCYDHMGKYYNLGEKIISCNTCETWFCECPSCSSASVFFSCTVMAESFENDTSYPITSLISFWLLSNQAQSSRQKVAFPGWKRDST